MISPLMMLGGIGIQALSSYKQGQAQGEQYGAQRQQSLYEATLADYDARQAEADALVASRRTDFEQMQALREGEAIKGSQLVGMAASGGRIDVGTNFLLRLQQSEETELDNFLIGLEGRTEANRLTAEAEANKRKASMLRSQAGYYGRAGKSARTAGKLGAASAILGGFGTMGAMGMFGGGRTANLSTVTSNAGVAPARSIISGNRWSP